MSAARPALRSVLAAAVLAVAAVPAVPAFSAVGGRHDLGTAPRAWSAMAGQDTATVMGLAATSASGEASGANDPYCDSDAEIARTLAHDFGEALVDDTRVGSQNTQLWGSAIMGTWTLVLARPDQTSCVVASGIGYRDDANPGVFYVKAGLTG